MEIKIEGNPGTGNTFQEINIGRVENYNPNATTVINNYGTREATKAKQPGPKEQVDTYYLREEILTYVSNLRTELAPEWKSRYQQVWTDILDLDIVAASVYNPGKQQGTNFNRNLVANIVHYLNGLGAFSDYKPAIFAERLEGDKEHSVRAALARDPDEAIVSRLNRYFE